MKKSYILLLTISILFSSCSVMNKSTNAAFFEAQADIEPVKAEVVVDDSKKISGKSKSVFLLGIIRISGDNKFADGVFRSYNPLDKVAPVSSAAAFKAIKSSGNHFRQERKYKDTNFSEKGTLLSQGIIFFGNLELVNGKINGHPTVDANRVRTAHVISNAALSIQSKNGNMYVVSNTNYTFNF